MFRPVEAFSWGSRLFDPSTEVDPADPAVAKFPHLFAPVDGYVPEPVKPVKRVGRPPKAKPTPEVEGD